jgi:hypothetical protein
VNARTIGPMLKKEWNTISIGTRTDLNGFVLGASALQITPTSVTQKSK